MKIRHLIQQLNQEPVAVSEFAKQYTEIISKLHDCIERNFSQVEQQFRNSLARVVNKYQSLYWVEAIREGFPHELWHVLSMRDNIEAHLQAHTYLRSQLFVDSDTINAVTKTDEILRQQGAELWAIDSGTIQDQKTRLKSDPAENWWWWLDQLHG